MYRTHRLIFVFAIFLLILSSIVVSAADDVVSVVACGKALTLRVPARLVGERVFVPIESLSALGATSEGGDKRNNGRKIKITPANGQTFTCKSSLIDNELMLPISDIENKLGIVTDWNDAARRLTMKSIVRKIDYNGTELKVTTSCPVSPATLDTKWTRSSNKLVLDLPGTQFPANKDDLKIVNLTNTPINTGLKEDGETARVVLDLPMAVKHILTSANMTSVIVVSLSDIRSPLGSHTETPTHTTVMPMPAPTQTPVHAPTPIPAPVPVPEPAPSVEPQMTNVSGLDFRKVNTGVMEVYIPASEQTKCVTSMSRQPFQLNIDISHATLSREIEDIQLKHELLQCIHIEQKDPTTVRVTMSLSRIAGFDVRWDSISSRFIATLELPKGAGGLLSQKVIVIDPGHGGEDDGARGNTNTHEKDYNLQIATRVQRLLTQAGACVIMTRKSDVYISLQERVNMAQRHSANLFLSIHCNSCPIPNSVSGIETFFHGQDPNGRALAECIHSEVMKSSDLPDRNLKSDTKRFKTGFAVLRGTSAAGIPSNLIEVGFLNHNTDECAIIDPECQERLAKGMVRGLKLYVEGNP